MQQIQMENLPRFRTLKSARLYMEAVDRGEDVSPYDFDAVPSHITEILERGLAVVPNPEYEDARYGLAYFIKKDESDEQNKLETQKEA